MGFTATISSCKLTEGWEVSVKNVISLLKVKHIDQKIKAYLRCSNTNALLCNKLIRQYFRKRWYSSFGILYKNEDVVKVKCIFNGNSIS